LDSYRPESDKDPVETREWLDSLKSVVEHEGRERARFLLERTIEDGRRQGVAPVLPLNTDYVNTVRLEDEPEFPGDEALERRIRRIIRWNAAAMVHRANKKFDGLGGHISTYASSASLYEIGFNHFFRGKDGDSLGDQVYYQGHASPGMYSRSFLEGRITVDHMNHFRRETERGRGLSSYPHPRLMPDYWEFPTVSMGLGPIGAIYQARFNRYMENRGLADTSKSHVWCFVGDGETDEPETLGALRIAAGEKLDNLTFIVNCNLQRLDGPVRGNGKIIQDLEAVFRGSGWDVTKVIWGDNWDELFARDHEGVLREHLNAVVDGEWQRLTTASGETVRKVFFARDPRMLELVSHLSDEQVARCAVAVTAIARCTPATSAPWRARGARRSFWLIPSKVGAWAKPSRAATSRTRRRRCKPRSSRRSATCFSCRSPTTRSRSFRSTTRARTAPRCST